MLGSFESGVLVDQCNVLNQYFHRMKTYDLNLLRALQVLLESASVTLAAERLHLSVPATSHTLARLREAMGDPLLVRAGRALVPTPRALALKEPVARLVAEADALVAAAPAKAALADVTRNFVIRAPEGHAVVFGAALAAAIESVMPGSSLHLVAQAQGDTSALREGRIDLDVGSLRGRDPEVLTLELSRQRLVVVVHPDAAPQGRLTVIRYAALRHVAVAQRAREASPVDEALEALGQRRHVLLTLPSAHAALLAAARSTLAATVPERLARAMSASLDLRVFELPFEVKVEPMLMAWHPRQDSDPAHRWLRNTVQRIVTDPQSVPPLTPWSDQRARAARAATGARTRPGKV